MRVSAAQVHYDIAIIGGGLVGASFACLLAQALEGSGLRILVTEAASTPQSSNSFDARSTALSYGSEQIYRQLGLWQALAPYATAIERIHVSDRGHFGAVRLDHRDFGVNALGQVVENQHLGIVLTQALEHSPVLDFLCPAIVTRANPTPTGMTLALKGDTPREVSASLVVLADGGRSPLTQQLGIESALTHYGQSAIIANIAFAQPHAHVAYERFTDTGPLAVLPLATQEQQPRGALVWTVGSDEAAAHMALTDAAFLETLQRRFGHRLGQLTRVGTRSVYPLTLSVAREQIRPGLVLLGNVAHTLHPVAGQGLNLALRDAAALAAILAQAAEQKEALGSMAVLQRYEQQQQQDQSATILFSHAMTQLFSSTHPVLVWARKFGLLSIDLLPPLKRTLARQAMGLGARERRA